ncbi:MAG: hypothetical protein CLLPBCKN_008596 [Chroococcidiopsis cubana SAG 39.79]|uniref:hypothetical protein n=1 Tax=Chroococcidiopsis cubana TaxID=171392 RepID=UPI002AC628D4|nr:hypothetical protein [Chroococcidiopsis cubana]MDZ4879158.1 hypothetical protein [Chroococcidiopsis cubana SAG 39.79]
MRFLWESGEPILMDEVLAWARANPDLIPALSRDTVIFGKMVAKLLLCLGFKDFSTQVNHRLSVVGYCV